jgi:hypothetical protein
MTSTDPGTVIDVKPLPGNFFMHCIPGDGDLSLPSIPIASKMDSLLDSIDVVMFVRVWTSIVQ